LIQIIAPFLPTRILRHMSSTCRELRSAIARCEMLRRHATTIDTREALGREIARLKAELCDTELSEIMLARRARKRGRNARSCGGAMSDMSLFEDRRMDRAA
jgi:hypothetical protein